MPQTSEGLRRRLLRRCGLTVLAAVAVVLLVSPAAVHVGHVVVRVSPLQVGWLLADVALVLTPVLVPIASWTSLRRDPMTRAGATAAALVISCALSVLSFLFAAFWV